MKKLLFALSFMFVASIACAQTATPLKTLAWDQPNASVAEASSMTVKHYDDGSSTGVALTGVTCSAIGTPLVTSCSTLFPAFTPGPHALTLTASNVAGESLKSTSLSFTFMIAPFTPTNVRIQ